MSIGEVLGQLRPDFADITISKIRFLESEGLVEPERTASGYRKFSREDLARLRYVLTAQRDHYLPLRVIKEHLEAIDRGLEPPALARRPEGAARARRGRGPAGADAFLPEVSEIRLSRKELLSAAGLQPEQLDQLEQYGLLSARAGGSHYDGDALVVAKTVAEMARFGHRGAPPAAVQGRRRARDRARRAGRHAARAPAQPRGPRPAEEVARELAALSVKLHATLVRAGLGPGLRR
jgi:DNA-binding transcriptional MerR regulator